MYCLQCLDTLKNLSMSIYIYLNSTQLSQLWASVNKNDKKRSSWDKIKQSKTRELPSKYHFILFLYWLLLKSHDSGSARQANVQPLNATRSPIHCLSNISKYIIDISIYLKLYRLQKQKYSQHQSTKKNCPSWAMQSVDSGPQSQLLCFTVLSIDGQHQITIIRVFTVCEL